MNLRRSDVFSERDIFGERKEKKEKLRRRRRRKKLKN